MQTIWDRARLALPSEGWALGGRAALVVTEDELAECVRAPPDGLHHHIVTENPWLFGVRGTTEYLRHVPRCLELYVMATQPAQLSVYSTGGYHSPDVCGAVWNISLMVTWPVVWAPWPVHVWTRWAPPRPAEAVWAASIVSNKRSHGWIHPVTRPELHAMMELARERGWHCVLDAHRPHPVHNAECLRVVGLGRGGMQWTLDGTELSVRRNEIEADVYVFYKPN